MDPDPDPGGPKTVGSGSATLQVLCTVPGLLHNLKILFSYYCIESNFAIFRKICTNVHCLRVEERTLLPDKSLQVIYWTLAGAGVRHRGVQRQRHAEQEAAARARGQHAQQHLCLQPLPSHRQGEPVGVAVTAASVAVVAAAIAVAVAVVSVAVAADAVPVPVPFPVCS